MFSLESPHWGDSNEYKQYTILSIPKKVAKNYSKSAALEFFQRTKYEFETAMVNEQSVFDQLKFYCIHSRLSLSRNRRDPLKHFDTSILRHIRFVVLRKRTIWTTKFHKWLCNVTSLVINIYWKYCGKGEKLLPRSNFYSFPQYFVTWFLISVLKQGPNFLFEISGDLG